MNSFKYTLKEKPLQKPSSKDGLKEVKSQPAGRICHICAKNPLPTSPSM
jgi:hypothetical protein